MQEMRSMLFVAQIIRGGAGYIAVVQKEERL